MTKIQTKQLTLEEYENFKQIEKIYLHEKCKQEHKVMLNNQIIHLNLIKNSNKILNAITTINPFNSRLIKIPYLNQQNLVPAIYRVSTYIENEEKLNNYFIIYTNDNYYVINIQSNKDEIELNVENLKVIGQLVREPFKLIECEDHVFKILNALFK